MDHINRILAQIDAESEGITYVELLAEKLRVRRAYAVLGASVLAFALFFLGFGAPMLCHVIGIIYPALASFRAIESRSTEDDTQWLMYWVIFSIFNIIEVVIDHILHWFPAYYTLKIAFLLYCQLPFFNGAQFLYTQFAGPWFRKHRPAIDAQIARLGGATRGFREAIETAARPAVTPAAVVEATLDAADLFGTGPLRQRSSAAGGVATHAPSGVSSGEGKKAS